MFQFGNYPHVKLVVHEVDEDVVFEAEHLGDLLVDPWFDCVQVHLAGVNLKNNIEYRQV